MRSKAFTSTFSLFFLVIVAGCIVVPLPPGMAVYLTEYEIKEHVKNRSSREDMIDLLGHPTRQYETDISYRACRKGAGMFYAVGIPDAGVAGLYRSDTKCFELILHFDNNDRLTSYEKHPLDPPFTANFKTPHGEVLPTIRLMAENGIPESQWRLYNDYGQKPSDTIWLCRSADNGYAKAQLHVGTLYWSATDITQNKSKAYVWYKLAATGDKIQGLLHDESTQTLAEKVMSDTEKVLTREQLEVAESLYSDWHPGQCELELIPAITDN